MFNRYYQQELQHLRELAGEFAKVHPAAAPMLGDQSADPDVERLLEGVAFLTGLMRQKLDDELPEIVRGLMDVILPHYLRPIPAVSIVAFTPKPSLLESIKVPAGTSLRSVAVEDADCTFQTCFDLEVHPLTLLSAEFLQPVGESGRIRLSLELKGQALSQWRPTRLSLFLAGSYVHSSDLFMLLTRGIERIRIVPLGRGRCLHLVCAVPEARRVRAGQQPVSVSHPGVYGIPSASGVLSAATEISFPGPGRLGAVDQPGRGSAFRYRL